MKQMVKIYFTNKLYLIEKNTHYGITQPFSKEYQIKQDMMDKKVYRQLSKMLLFKLQERKLVTFQNSQLILQINYLSILYLQQYIMLNLSSDKKLNSVYQTIFQCCTEITILMRETIVLTLESINKFGDTQLHLDVAADLLIEKHLKENENIAAFISQQRPQYNHIKNQGYVVTYDPLDGSSVIDTNFAIGSIFGIWKNSQSKLINEKISNSLVNGIIVVYGPRTTCTIFNENTNQVQEYTLIGGKWQQSEQTLRIKDVAKLFAPGNLRAASDNKEYMHVVNKWMERGMTLRYSGGLGPDANQILLKGNGILVNVGSKNHPAKLRVLYEVAPIGYLIEKGGGKTLTTGKKSILDCYIKSYDDKVQFILGSKSEVQMIAHLIE